MKSSTTFAFLSLTLFCTSVAYADPFGSGLNSFDIEFVDIGSPGNAADTTGDPNPVGSVAQSYRIGKFEISRDMILKANAEGGLGIALPDMSLFGGNGVNRPATGTTWFEAAQFVNWLNTSTGNAPAYNFDGGGNFNCGNRAMRAMIRTIFFAAAWRRIFCPASTSGTRRPITIQPVESISTSRQVATRHPRPWLAERQQAPPCSIRPFSLQDPRTSRRPVA